MYHTQRKEGETMNKHTPGPWYGKEQGGPHNQALVVSEQDGRNVAVCYDARDMPLIAAAPDLLAALEEIANTDTEGFGILDFGVSCSHFIAVAKAAIAKAKGE